MQNDTIVINSGTDPVGARSIRWQETAEGEWEAMATFYNPDMNYRLYDLDAVDLTQVMATTAQYMRGDLPLVYLEPRDSALRRRLSPDLNPKV